MGDEGLGLASRCASNKEGLSLTPIRAPGRCAPNAPYGRILLAHFSPQLPMY